MGILRSSNGGNEESSEVRYDEAGNTGLKYIHRLRGRNGEPETLLVEHPGPSECFYRHFPSLPVVGLCCWKGCLTGPKRRESKT